MSQRYQPPREVPGALRLHLNENTGGCSPAVIEAIRRVSAEEIALYPAYDTLTRECAAYLGVAESQLALVNGLDEGLLCACVACFRPSGPARAASGAGLPADSVRDIPEGLIVLPAFEMYAIQIRAVGGRVVAVRSRADFEFPTDELLQAVTPSTRIIFLTSPNNPTGLLIPRHTIGRIARTVPSDVTVVVDEAYYEFCGETFVSELPDHPNVIVGRTFAKAHGLAGLRAGCLIGAPARLEPIRNVIPPYNINVLTSAAWLAALKDREYLTWYQTEVAASKQAVYALCDRLGLKYWRSAGNFVLIRVGEGAERLVAQMAARGILIKDRSREHGCEGCVRLTAGVLEHTETALAALEDILCEGR